MTEYVFYGKVSGSLLRREMNTPLIFTLTEARQLIPVYPQTAGINSRFLAAEVRLALSGLLETLEETIPADIKVQNQLCHLQYAIENIHFPASRHDMLIARRRLIFEELFTLSLALSAVRTARDTPAPVAMQPVEIEDFLGSLPFALTEAQLRSVREICGDLAGSTPMNRLLQGDVGSGKTVVAACAWRICGPEPHPVCPDGAHRDPRRPALGNHAEIPRSHRAAGGAAHRFHQGLGEKAHPGRSGCG